MCTPDRVLQYQGAQSLAAELQSLVPYIFRGGHIQRLDGYGSVAAPLLEPHVCDTEKLGCLLLRGEEDQVVYHQKLRCQHCVPAVERPKLKEFELTRTLLLVWGVERRDLKVSN